MTVYKDQMKASMKIDEMIFKAMDEKKNLSVSLLILEITRHFPVGEKFIIKRLEQFQNAYADIKIKDNEVIFL